MLKIHYFISKYKKVYNDDLTSSRTLNNNEDPNSFVLDMKGRFSINVKL